ncbi:hypothetical protein ABIC63_001165 [Pseudacidovorax sp. 1753]|uniref:FliM/FliN family flagellar motor C-terminal domain-containing protein n=1 Tax=Pseudacidovorax sp. 1753 TaxID=3156419 RepID=UPI0033980DBB
MLSSVGESSALMDAAEASRRAQPLRYWSQAQRSALATQFSQLLETWRSDWFRADGRADDPPQVAVLEADGTWSRAREGTVYWSIEAPAGSEGAFVEPAREDRNASDASEGLAIAVRIVAAQMFFMASPSASSTKGLAGAFNLPSDGLAIALAGSAVADWMTRLRGMFKVEALEHRDALVGALSEARAHAWSGALRIRADWCGYGWVVDVPYDVVRTLLSVPSSMPKPRTSDLPATRTAKSRLDAVLADRQVELRVMLDGVQLNLGQLQGLSVGDVVPLDHSLDVPAHVVDLDGTAVCEAWLGQSAGRMAVELVPSASALEERPLNAAAKAQTTTSYSGIPLHVQKPKGSLQ